MNQTQNKHRVPTTRWQTLFYFPHVKRHDWIGLLMTLILAAAALIMASRTVSAQSDIPRASGSCSQHIRMPEQMLMTYSHMVFSPSYELALGVHDQEALRYFNGYDDTFSTCHIKAGASPGFVVFPRSGIRQFVAPGEDWYGFFGPGDPRLAERFWFEDNFTRPARSSVIQVPLGTPPAPRLSSPSVNWNANLYGSCFYTSEMELIFVGNRLETIMYHSWIEDWVTRLGATIPCIVHSKVPALVKVESGQIYHLPPGGTWSWIYRPGSPIFDFKVEMIDSQGDKDCVFCLPGLYFSYAGAWHAYGTSNGAPLRIFVDGQEFFPQPEDEQYPDIRRTVGDYDQGYGSNSYGSPVFESHRSGLVFIETRGNLLYVKFDDKWWGLPQPRS